MQLHVNTICTVIAMGWPITRSEGPDGHRDSWWSGQLLLWTAPKCRHSRAKTFSKDKPPTWWAAEQRYVAAFEQARLLLNLNLADLRVRYSHIYKKKKYPHEVSSNREILSSMLCSLISKISRLIDDKIKKMKTQQNSSNIWLYAFCFIEYVFRKVDSAINHWLLTWY